MSDAWDFYFARVNGELASLFVDLGIRNRVPDQQRPWLLWVWVKFEKPWDDGLSSDEEAPRLFEIEDTLTKRVRETTAAELVGRITTAGRREFYFYGPRPDGFREAATDVFKDFPAYSFQLGDKEDPAWSQYLDVLYPTARMRQQIDNRRVIEALEKQGDPLTAPRPVSHWAYFPSAQKRTEFVTRVKPKGFKVTDESENDDPAAKYRYGVTLERTDRVDWQSINEVTLELFDLAQELGGEYDGWETTVEKDV
jgi:regulator of RNase E activity RraB